MRSYTRAMCLSEKGDLIDVSSDDPCSNDLMTSSIQYYDLYYSFKSTERCELTNE